MTYQEQIAGAATLIRGYNGTWVGKHFFCIIAQRSRIGGYNGTAPMTHNG